MECAVQSFPRFMKLPAELRRLIWRECLPWRVYEIDWPYANGIFGVDPLPGEKSELPCTLGATSSLNARPPVITRVCRESRAVAFEEGSLVEDTRAVPATVQFHNNNTMRGPVWRDGVRDIVHLNWDIIHIIEFFGADDIARPLLYLEFLLAKSASCGSLTARYLQPNYRWTLPAFMRRPAEPYCSWFHDASDLHLITDILSRRSEWLVVMRSVVVHASMRAGAASGLFGLLGDAPVQIIDVTEVEKLDALYAMARDCEAGGQVQLAQNFQRDSAHELEEQLADVLSGCYGITQPTFRLRPAIMFHLCPLMCNHVGQQVDSWDLPDPRSELRIMYDSWRRSKERRGQ